MRPIEISHIINAFLESSNIGGKCIVRKKVEHSKVVKSLITITLELYYFNGKNKKIEEVSKTSNSNKEDETTSILCEQLVSKIMVTWEEFRNAIQ